MLSIVINFFNNRREARNTLFAFTRAYQHNAQEIAYEVIAVDNGSPQPLSEADVKAFGPEFNYRFFPTTSKSPAQAINAACRCAQGEHLLVMIDGAQIVTPGMLYGASLAFRLFPRVFVATLGFDLGPKNQGQSVLEGYNQQVEDAMLQRSRWRESGYRLFSCVGQFADGSLGWFGCFFESCCFGLRKEDYFALGGFDERFQSRGGGCANMDFYQSALARPDLEYVMLLGEATFHQLHRSLADAPTDRQGWDEFHQEYMRIRGKPFQRCLRRPFFLGQIPKEALHIAQTSAQFGLDFWREQPHA